ncbi:MAG: hypothetical protein K9L31_02765 [Candidatus Pacebacteria bacterium]|nr:hypothetical protein [Candidatus Paceibacterota bacterium]
METVILEVDAVEESFRVLMEKTGLSVEEVLQQSSDLFLQMADEVQKGRTVVSMMGDGKTYKHLLFPPLIHLKGGGK